MNLRVAPVQRTFERGIFRCHLASDLGANSLREVGRFTGVPFAAGNLWSTSRLGTGHYGLASGEARLECCSVLGSLHLSMLMSESAHKAVFLSYASQR